MSKILLLTAMMLVLLIVVSFTGYRTSNSINYDMNNLYKNYAMPAIWMEEMKSISIQNRHLILSMLNTTEMDEIWAHDSKIKENRKRINELLALYANIDQTSEEKAMVSKIETVMLTVDKLQDEVIDAQKNDRGEKSAYLLDSVKAGSEIANAANKNIELIDELVDMLVMRADEVSSRASATAGAGIMRIIILSAAAVTLGIALGLLISGTITGGIAGIENSIKTFADGDLTISFPATGRDELAQMGRELGSMAETLKNIIKSVKTASEHIAGSSEEFSALAEETNATMEEFRSSVDAIGLELNSLAATGEEVNASVEEVAAGAQSTAEKGTDIARQVEAAMNAGENGMTAVQKTMSGIGGVVRNATEAVRSVQELSSRTHRIQNFVAQIGGIADQTNLLALNAAIEAARAGEAGRGFAVVAEEVRKLAEDSNIAAKNIADLAETISGDLDHMVTVSLDNAKASQEAQNLSTEIENIISQMIISLKSIASSTQDLAAVSEEQAASSEEIAEAVQNISTKVASTASAGDQIRSGVGSVAASAERIAVRSEALSSLSAELENILTFFKLDKDTAKPGAQLKGISAKRLPSKI
jgi:methyl-accepting chemotaxis protein